MKLTLRKVREGGIHAWLFGCALLSVFTSAAIIWALASESAAFFREIPVTQFLFGTYWAPKMHPAGFGVLPLVCGTVLIAAGALLVAVPIGLASAVFLSEYAPAWFRQIAKPLLEVLAGVPTVVYGFFALMFVSPYLLQSISPDMPRVNAASAAIVMGIMILPMIASLCEDALRAVPRTLRDAGYALSATKLEVSTRIVLPAALSGVVAAVLLALARAIGETMIVAIAAGNLANLTLNPFGPTQTMTGFIAQVSMGDTPRGTVEYNTIFAVGVLLFIMTLVINLVADRVLRRYREAYE